MLSFAGGRSVPSLAAPVVPSPESVVDGATLEASRGIASRGWVTIFGTDLAPKTRGWTAGDFSGGVAPSSLEGVSVTIGGKPAFIAFLMRGADFGLTYDQINVLAPADDTAAEVPVVVHTPGGSSAPVMVRRGAVSPAFFPFEPERRRYVAASAADGREYIGKATLFGSNHLDRPMRPARIGEIITLFGSGFGAIEGLPHGAIPGAATPLARKVIIRFGGTEAAVLYAGAAPGLAGVTQFNVEVPILPAGEYEITAEIDGVRTPAGKYVVLADVPYPSFDHAKYSEFRLTGAHVFADCNGCHLNGKFRGTPAGCVACHVDRYDKTTAPNHAASNYPKDCGSCHITSSFRGAVSHQNNRFPLTGRHASLACAACHADGRYESRDTLCSSCHFDRYRAATAHEKAGYGTNCAGCHNTTSFANPNFDHSRLRVPLTGAHARLECAACHTGAQYGAVRADCAACHQNRYEAATSPNHRNAGYPAECAMCHTTAGWKGAVINHTKFALTGTHTAAQCSSCHAGGRFAGTPRVCAECHTDRYNATTNPNHKAAGFPADCALCHSTTQFRGARFPHTKFELTGAHSTKAQCSSCHTGGRYAGTPQDCASCHLPRYQATGNPNHGAAGFPQTCNTCHTTTAFTPATFSHTKFALTGAHSTKAQCSSCHTGGRYAGTPQDCASCHLSRYQATSNPNHAAAGFPQTCGTCHSTSAFTPATFSHTGFALTGAHSTKAQCSSCHTGGRYAGTPQDCASCHLSRYQATTNPNHGAAGFPQACNTCHTTTAFTPATFSHTKFALTGAHSTKAQCSSCHKGGRYAGTPQDCASCHLSRYQATTNPNHGAAGFPQTCNTCHTTTAFTPATFSHTKFALTGAHSTKAQCSSCHTGGRYAGTPQDCASCHLSRYQATTDPNHAAAGFPQTCGACHTTTAFRPAAFTHRFPITSGKHSGKSCSSCHVNPANFSEFSCLGCHRQSEIDSEHKGRAGYAYDSKACYSCHPAGKEP